MNEQQPWFRLRTVLAAEDRERASAEVEALDAHELARALGHLSTDDVAGLLELLQVEVAADALDRISESQAAEALTEVSPELAARLLAEMTLREQADLLEAVDAAEAEEILEAMDEPAAESLRSLTTYPDGTAGALMDPDFMSFESDTSLREVVAALQEGAETFQDYQVQYLHVTRDGRLVGVARLRDVVFHRADTPISAVALPEVVTVEASADLDRVTRTFADNDFLGIPVVEDGRLLGVVHRAAVEHALAEIADTEHLKSQGIVGGEELRSLPLLTRSARRLSWLSINVVLNVLAASVIAFYQGTLEAVIALAAFLPIISDMSGCSGNQAVAVSMRELSLGIVSPRDALHVWRKELGVALLNGVVLGALLAGIAWLWQQNLFLSLVVGVALAINTVVAVSIGGVVPLALRGLGLDPALASGPILTTVTDMSGFLLALGLATAWISRIVGA